MVFRQPAPTPESWYDAYADLGGRMPPRLAVYRSALRARDAAQMALELAMDGADCDVPRAIKCLDRCAEIAGRAGDWAKNRNGETE